MGRRSVDDDFASFVAACSGRLVGIATLLCGDRGLAEDLVQSALEKAYLRWDRIDGDPFSYVRRAVVNHHVSWLRRRPSTERPAGRPVELPNDTRTQIADHAGEVQHRTLVLQALAGLTRREQAVVVLRYVEDLSEAETARALGVAPGTVKSTAARALGKLRSAPELSEIYLEEPA